jgi:hypothetical protein
MFGPRVWHRVQIGTDRIVGIAIGMIKDTSYIVLVVPHCQMVQYFSSVMLNLRCPWPMRSPIRSFPFILALHILGRSFSRITVRMRRIILSRIGATVQKRLWNETVSFIGKDLIVDGSGYFRKMENMS